MSPFSKLIGSKAGRGYVGNLLIIQMGTFVIVDLRSKAAVRCFDGSFVHDPIHSARDGGGWSILEKAAHSHWVVSSTPS